MIFKYAIDATLEIIEVWQPTREAAEAKVKEVLARLPYGGEFRQDRFFLESEGDYRILSSNF